MNNSTQLSLLNIPEPSVTFDVNRLDAVRLNEDHMPTSGSAASALSTRTVDDRVFHMGMTNWKAVIDRALLLGHSELHDSGTGRQGLRKHGHRFSPIPLLPARAAEYVKERLLLTGATKLTKTSKVRLGCSASLPNGMQLKVSLTSNGTEVFIADGAQRISILISFEVTPFSDGLAPDDINLIGKLATKMLKRQASTQGLMLKLGAADTTVIGNCVLAQVIKIQELAAWNA
jgi:hypothetical protein